MTEQSPRWTYYRGPGGVWWSPDDLDAEGYPAGWHLVAAAVKQAADWECVRCGHPHDPLAGYTLTVHHLDLDKTNCQWWNLPALCQRCHLSVQARVKMHQLWMGEHTPWFKPFVAGWAAHHLLHEEVTREELQERPEYQEILLALARGEA